MSTRDQSLPSSCAFEERVAHDAASSKRDADKATKRDADQATKIVQIAQLRAVFTPEFVNSAANSEVRMMLGEHLAVLGAKKMAKLCRRTHRKEARCDNCGVAGAHRKCSGCHRRFRARYCDPECQLAHSDRHGHDCPRLDKKSCLEVLHPDYIAVHCQLLEERSPCCAECFDNDMKLLIEVCSPAEYSLGMVSSSPAEYSLGMVSSNVFLPCI